MPAATVTLLVALLLSGLGCTPPPNAARGPRCPRAGWRAVADPDSVFTLCTPADFVRLDIVRDVPGAFWTRPQPGAPEPQAALGPAWVSVAFIPAAVARSAPRPWPQSLAALAGQPCNDCDTFDSVVVHPDSVGDRAIRVETARARSFFGGRSHVQLLATWPAGGGAWLTVYGAGRDSAAVAELREIVRTVRADPRCLDARWPAVAVRRLTKRCS